MVAIQTSQYEPGVLGIYPCARSETATAQALVDNMNHRFGLSLRPPKDDHMTTYYVALTHCRSVPSYSTASTSVDAALREKYS